jgi:hypothetical protein
MSKLSMPSRLILENGKIDMVYDTYEALLSDEYFSLQIEKHVNFKELNEIKRGLLNKRIPTSVLLNLSEIIELELANENDLMLMEIKRKNIGIAAKAYYIAVLKGQLTLGYDHPITYYLRNRLNKRIRVRLH